MPLSHLRELPEAALLNMVRHLSSKPREIDWMSFLEPEDAVVSMGYSCPLSSVARSAFSTINTGYIFSRNKAVLISDWLQLSGDSLVSMTLGDWLTSGPIENGRFNKGEPETSNRRGLQARRSFV